LSNKGEAASAAKLGREMSTELRALVSDASDELTALLATLDRDSDAVKPAASSRRVDSESRRTRDKTRDSDK
jgi:hypothetical protein